jgi:hypothetical protein
MTTTLPQLRDRHDYQRAARDLARQGLTERDIAELLRITTNAVHELLGVPTAVRNGKATDE